MGPTYEVLQRTTDDRTNQMDGLQWKHWWNSPTSPICSTLWGLFKGLETLKCRCLFNVKLQRNCVICWEKCVFCQKPWKDFLIFYYLPFIYIFANIVLNKTRCYHLLEIWRKKIVSLGKQLINFWIFLKFGMGWNLKNFKISKILG